MSRVWAGVQDVAVLCATSRLTEGGCRGRGGGGCGGRSEKPPVALIQLLSDVFAYVAEHAATDVSLETPDAWTMRLMEFLRIVKYQGAHDALTLRQGLYNGDTLVVYPVLKWVLPQVEGLKKRAFVGYYLSKVQVRTTAESPFGYIYIRTAMGWWAAGEAWVVRYL